MFKLSEFRRKISLLMYEVVRPVEHVFQFSGMLTSVGYLLALEVLQEGVESQAEVRS